MVSNEGENLIFIFSLPRSGSTLLSAILGNSSLVYCPPEPWFLLRLAEVMGDPSADKVFDDYFANLATKEFLTKESFIESSRAFATQAYNNRLQEKKSKIFVDKTPRYYHILDYIDLVFPKAKKIWLKRNPLDIAASYQTSWGVSVAMLTGKKIGPPSFDFILGLSLLKEYFQERTSFKYEVKYEDIACHPEKAIEELCCFCEIPYDEGMLLYGRNENLINAMKNAAVGDRLVLEHESVHINSLEKWKDLFSKDDLRELINVIGITTLKQMDYEKTVEDLSDFKIELEPIDTKIRTAHLFNILEKGHFGIIYEETLTLRSKVSELQHYYDQAIEDIKFLQQEIRNRDQEIRNRDQEINKREQQLQQLNQWISELKQRQSYKAYKTIKNLFQKKKYQQIVSNTVTNKKNINNIGNASLRIHENKTKKASFEDEIVQYALNEDNYENFAHLLKKILPVYSSWAWGLDNIYRRHFNDWQRSGFNLIPHHFYSPVPDISQIDKVYKNKTEMIGIDMRETKQLKFLDTVCSVFKKEYENFPEKKTEIGYEFHFNNGVFERVDAEVLYCMIRHYKPNKMIEIGSGYSTLVSAAACSINKKKDGIDCNFSAIEPFPNDIFKRDIPGLSCLIDKPLQEVDLNLFSTLKKNDILFIDSAHVLKIGSDVQSEYLEIIPRLHHGVIVHIHDIFLPAEYPKSWIKEEHVFWNEQYLLQAFLSFNDTFEILWAGSFMHLKHPDKLVNHFPGYLPNKNIPGSFWIRRVK